LIKRLARLLKEGPSFVVLAAIFFLLVLPLGLLRRLGRRRSPLVLSYFIESGKGDELVARMDQPF
jgi:hypothetical protein